MVRDLRIALINPAWDIRTYTPWIPLGLVYLGTVLKEHGFSIKLLDAAAHRYDLAKILQWIEHVNPDIVGISAMTMSFLASIHLAKAIKGWNPNIKIVLGHYHPTIEAENIIQKYSEIVDYCVRGEGEQIFLNLSRFLEENPERDPVDIKGLTFKDAYKKIISTPNPSLIMDLDKIPFPDRTLIDFEYKWSFAGFEVLNSKFTTMLSSRGCPYNCTYCACSKFARRKWRPRSPENIIEEMAIIQDQGYTELSFIDDNFTLNSKRVIKLCELMKKERIDINWHTDGRVDQISQDMLDWMHHAGCRSIWYGFESANQRILDLYNKKTKVTQFHDAIRAARKAKIDIIVGLFMMGAPTETLEEIRNTIHFALTADLDLPFFNIVDIYSGIKLWQDYVDRGVISPYDIVMVKQGEIVFEVERWETTTNVMELSLPRKKYEFLLNEIQEAYKSFFSFKRAPLLLKQTLRMMKSRFMSSMALNFLGHFPYAVNAFIKIRNLRPKGFGRYEET